MRKSIFFCAVAVLALLPSAVVANGLEIKGGVGSVKAANDKAGFDAAIAYSLKLERFFAFVPELNFNWINFDQCKSNPCQQAQIGGFTGDIKTTRNHFTLPLLLNARLLIPMGTEDTPAVQPYVTIGAGYAWSFYEEKTPEYTQGSTTTPAEVKNDSAAGFMYQAMVGVSFNLGMLTEGSASATSLLLEAGYRGGEVERSPIKIDMSGYVVRVGAAFNF